MVDKNAHILCILLLMIHCNIYTDVFLYQEEILEALDKACSLLPASLNASCKDFINKYVPAIIEMLRQEVDPQEVCTLLGLCSGVPVAAAVAQRKCLIL